MLDDDVICYEENEQDRMTRELCKEIQGKIRDTLQESFVGSAIGSETKESIKAKIKNLILHYIHMTGVTKKFDVLVEISGMHHADIKIVDENGVPFKDLAELFS